MDFFNNLKRNYNISKEQIYANGATAKATLWDTVVLPYKEPRYDQAFWKKEKEKVIDIIKWDQKQNNRNRDSLAKNPLYTQVTKYIEGHKSNVRR